MAWNIYGILIVFGIFIILFILNPNLSCFGRKIRSPLYPLFRKKKQKEDKVEDYGFYLVDDSPANKPKDKKSEGKKI